MSDVSNKMPDTGKKAARIRNERIVAQYRAGASLEAVGNDFGITRERVRQILESAGCPRRLMTVTEKFISSRRKPKKLIAKAILEKLYAEEKLSLNRIRRQLKTTLLIIYRSLERHGIKRRSEQENKLRLRKRPDLDCRTLHKLYIEDDLSAREIAETFDYAAATVKTRLSRSGIRKSDLKAEKSEESKEKD